MYQVMNKQYHGTLYKRFIVSVIGKMVRELINYMAHSIIIYLTIQRVAF